MYRTTLTGAFLACANLSGSRLSDAHFGGAILGGAILAGVELDWQSRGLIAEMIRLAAGEDANKLKLADSILECGWRWDRFFTSTHPLKGWVIEVLAPYAKGDPSLAAAMLKMLVTPKA